jgi:signal transduction histidine kinase
MAEVTSTTRRSRQWAVGVALWVMLLPLGLLLVRLALPSDGLLTLDPAGGFLQGQSVIAPVKAVDGIVTGDRLVAINGVPIADVASAPRPRTVRPGQLLTYRVEHAGAERDVAVRLHARADVVAELGSELPILLTTLAFVALAGWLIWKRPDELAAHAFLLFATGWGSQQLLFGLEPLDLWARPLVLFASAAGMAGYVLSALATLLFACTFPRPAPWFARRPWMATAIVPVVLTLVFAAAMATGAGGVGLPPAANSVAEVFWEVLTATAIGVAIVRWTRLRRDAAALRRVQLVALGFAFTFGSGLLVRWTDLHPSVALFPIALAVFPASIALAIFKRDLYDLDVTLSRALVATVCTAVLLGLYLATAWLTAAIAGRSDPLVALPAAGLVAVAFAPVRFRAERLINRRLFGTGGDPRLVLHRMGQRLAQADDPDALIAAVVDTAAESLRLPYAAVELKGNDGWQVVEERGRRPQPLDGRDNLERFDMVAGESVVGRLVVAPRRDARVLSPVDRQLLGDLASHSGVAARVTGLLTELRRAQQRLLVAREAERHRIHRDLHDSIGPSLVGLSLQLEVAGELAGDGDLGALVMRLHAESARAAEDVRRLVRALRPADLEELGLPAAVAAAAARLRAPSAPRFDLDTPLRLPDLSAEVEDAAYKICLEAMTNALRHSRAKQCSVRLAPADHDALHIDVVDDGCGFPDGTDLGTGLSSMQERAAAVGGWLRVASQPGGGTAVSAELPTRVLARKLS